MDSGLTVLGLGFDPRIFKDISKIAKQEPVEKLILTYNPKKSDDFDPFGIFDLLELFGLLSYFF